MALAQKVYLGLGSNLGDKKQLLTQAVSLIDKAIGPIQRTSRIYVSSALNPAENPDMQQPDYYNMAVRCESSLSAREILGKVQEIESSLGLDRSSKIYWGPRLIDIDILAIDDQIVDSEDLKLPHPEMCKRDFVLLPLFETDPNFIHPVSKKFIAQLISDLQRDAPASHIKDKLIF